MTHSRRGEAEAGAFEQSHAATWRHIQAQLAPIVGGRAVHVLLDRELQQIAASFTWFTFPSVPYADMDALLNDLEAQLAGQSVISATEACFALRLAFNELLGTMIGNSLTERLVGGVRDFQPPPSRTEPQHD